MKNLITVFALIGLGVLLAGCNSEEKTVTKQESDMLRKPLGQPMPEEAKRAMAEAMKKQPGAAPPGPR